MTLPPYFQIHHIPEQALVRSQWMRIVDSCEYRQSIMAVCHLITSSNATYWLIDSRASTSPNLSDQSWTAELIGRSLAKTKLRKIAIILPNDLFVEVVAEKIAAHIQRVAQNQVQIAHFDNEQLAVYWLASVKEQEGLFRSTTVAASTTV